MTANSALNITYVSSKFIDLLGFNPLGKSFISLIDESDRNYFISVFEKIKTPVSDSSSVTLRIKDAHNKILIFSYCVVLDEEENALYFILTYIDTRREERYRNEMIALSVSYGDINLTKNRFDRIAGIWGTPVKLLLMPFWDDYNTGISVIANNMVADGYKELYLERLNRERLIDLYTSGRTDDSFEYKRIVDGTRVMWVSSTTHLFLDEASGDVCCFLFHKDIDDERQKSVLTRVDSGSDILTGIYNLSVGERIFNDALISCDSAALLLLDIDKFSNFNHVYGLEKGDRLLLETVDVLRSSFCQGEAILRAGNDSFAILIKDVYSDEAHENAERLSAAISLIGEKIEKVAKVSCCIGIALYPRNGSDFASLMSSAEKAVKKGIQYGGGEIVFCEDESTPVQLPQEDKDASAKRPFNLIRKKKVCMLRS